VLAGRVDIMVRNEEGALFHIEEQRNLSKADMYRFASYYFQDAKNGGIKSQTSLLRRVMSIQPKN